MDNRLKISDLTISPEEKTILFRAYYEPQQIQFVMDKLECGSWKAREMVGFWEYKGWVRVIRERFKSVRFATNTAVLSDEMPVVEAEAEDNGVGVGK